MARFNNFYESINSSILRDYCLEYGNVNAYDKGAYFLHEGDVGKLLGFVSEGYFKIRLLIQKGWSLLSDLYLRVSAWSILQIR